MKAAEFPILEYDPTPRGIIDPLQCLPRLELPEHCVLCYFNDAIEKALATLPHRMVYGLKSLMGTWPIYEVQWDERKLVLAHPRVGGPLAAATLEATIAFGCRKIVVCGPAGVLDREISYGEVIVARSAVRDEGTSYHYLPPSREAEASPVALAAIEATLNGHSVAYRVGKTWTTDAFYRETPLRIAQRRREGCVTVEMEAATFLAVAQFRGVMLGQFLLAGDDVSGTEWDRRDWGKRTDGHDRALALAAEACLKM